MYFRYSCKISVIFVANSPNSECVQSSAKLPQTWNLTKSVLWEPLCSLVSRRIGSPYQLRWLWCTRMSLGPTSAPQSFPSSYVSVYICNISSKFSFMRHPKSAVRQGEWPWHKRFRRYTIFYVHPNTSETTTTTTTKIWICTNEIDFYRFVQP
jgi:hypothetical protein